MKVCDNNYGEEVLYANWTPFVPHLQPAGEQRPGRETNAISDAELFLERLYLCQQI